MIILWDVTLVLNPVINKAVGGDMPMHDLVSQQANPVIPNVGDIFIIDERDIQPDNLWTEKCVEFYGLEFQVVSRLFSYRSKTVFIVCTPVKLVEGIWVKRRLN